MTPDKIKNYKTQPIVITKDVIECIRTHKSELIACDLIKETAFQNQCTQCGKSDDIWLTVKNDGSTAMCLDCATGITLDNSIEINCLSKTEMEKMKLFG